MSTAELIERLEKATGRDAELDRDIHAWLCEHELGWTWKSIGKDADGENESVILVPPDLSKGFTYPPKGKVHPHYHVPRDPITGSVDQAMWLVPSRCGWRLTQKLNGKFDAVVQRLRIPEAAESDLDIYEESNGRQTAALALATAACKARRIAALKARARATDAGG